MKRRRPLYGPQKPTALDRWYNLFGQVFRDYAGRAPSEGEWRRSYYAFQDGLDPDQAAVEIAGVRSRDPGPIKASRAFRSRKKAGAFARRIRGRHPEARISKRKKGAAVTWRTRSTRDPARGLSFPVRIRHYEPTYGTVYSRVRSASELRALVAELDREGIMYTILGSDSGAKRDPAKPKTPGFNSHLQIAFTADRRGRPVAYYWSGSIMRWIRMSYDRAKIAVATETATEVPYAPSLRTRLLREQRDPQAKTRYGVYPHAVWNHDHVVVRVAASSTARSRPRSRTAAWSPSASSRGGATPTRWQAGLPSTSA